MITNQLKENIIQGRSFLQVGFLFQYQLTNLVLLSFDLFDFLSFSWSHTNYFFLVLYSCVYEKALYSCLCKKFLWLFKFLVLILQSTCFICTTWKRKQTMEQQPHRACEQTKSKHKTKPGHVIFKGRFLAKYIVMFGSAWCLIMA